MKSSNFCIAYTNVLDEAYVFAKFTQIAYLNSCANI
jgi:hypothetical protein